MNTLALDEIYYIGSSFLDLVNTLNRHARGLNYIGCSGSCDQTETHLHKLAGDISNVALIVVGHADENRSLCRELLARGQLRFGKGFAKAIADAHDFSRRL